MRVRSFGLRRRFAIVTTLVVAAAVGIGVAGAGSARGATAHRAAVVVEVDGVIHTAKISFSSDWISGLDALRAAGFAPGVRVFGGNGGAVCALDVGGTTIGCPSDNTCLTCSPDSDYWSYWRALAGASRYTWSSLGAGNTQVHDGDVEAWNWSTGSAPSPFVSFNDAWPSTPTTTRPPASTARRPPVSPLTVGPVGPVAPTTTARADGGPGPTAPTIALVPSTTRPPASTDTTAERSTETSVRAADTSPRKVATAPVVAHGGGGSSWGLVGFAAILVLLLAAIVVARRRRRSAISAQ
ncbi:MAG TPA: hypothetical protein VH914_14000 [Acidimicrobiia bacterium]|jgi:MYXO-CTERM domain-containing protein|nr:hypothetical protein [Acidimicrobiia bacterium]